MDASQPKQATLACLLELRRPSLAAWYADPLASDVVEALRSSAVKTLQSRWRADAACFRLRVLQLACRFWLGEAVTPEYGQLLGLASDGYEQALLELVYGQLLVSCKYRQAHQHLDRGFALAACQLDSADYFCLVRRHELLKFLSLPDTPSPPQTLASLLAEAAVIRRLREGDVRRYRQAHFDTVG